MPTDFCAAEKTGFAALYEDHYSFRSVATRSADGRMTSANVKMIAHASAFFGEVGSWVHASFYRHYSVVEETQALIA